MSNIYIQEPVTNGKVLLKTSFGELEIELWSKEASSTCRNFIRRCLEDYYENTIFHRIIPNFIAQGGSRELCTTNVADNASAESKPTDPKSIEVHQRLRFVRRGLIACAATHSDLDDDSPLAASARNEFFITLDACPELQGKHTIFGKLTSKTLYNALKLHDIQLDANNRPLYPPTIEQAVVVNNPFPDLIVDPLLTTKAVEAEKAGKSTSSTASRKAAPSKNCLSFAGEDGDDDDDVGDEPQLKRPKKYLKSAHDFDDPFLSKRELNENVLNVSAASVDDSQSTLPPDSDINSGAKGLTRVEELRSQAEQLKLEIAREKMAAPLSSSLPSIPASSKKDEKQDATLHASSPSDSPYQQRLENARKYRPLHANKDKSEHEQRVFDRLSQFRGKLNAFGSSTQPTDADSKTIASDASVRPDNDADHGAAALFRHKLECTNDADSDDDGGLTVVNGFSADSKAVTARDASKQRTVEDYDLYDPRNPLNKQRREESKKRRTHGGVA